MKKISFVVLSLLVMLISACGSNDSEENSEPTDRNEDTNHEGGTSMTDDVRQASNHVGFQSLQMLDPNDDGNVFVSPASIWFAMSMVYNGASEDTKEEMTEALQLQGMDVEALNQQNATLMEKLTKSDEEIELDIANSIWLNPSYEFLDTFRQSVTDTYQAQLESLTTPEPINQWVSDQTNGKIEDIVNQIDPEHLALIVNATYFNGQWTYPFDENATRDRIFYKQDGYSVESPFMALNEELPYIETDSFQAVALPYGEDEQMQMELFLPNEDVAMDDFLQDFTSENWQNWRGKMEPTEGNLLMPKFSLEYEAELQSFFQSLGMEQAFQAENADFSNMFSSEQLEDLYIDKIVHKTFLEVDEEGTEAAGATSVEMKTTSIGIGETFQMELNRPFVLTISDKETDTILFMGTIYEPTTAD